MWPHGKIRSNESDGPPDWYLDKNFVTWAKNFFAGDFEIVQSCWSFIEKGEVSKDSTLYYVCERFRRRYQGWMGAVDENTILKKALEFEDNRNRPNTEDAVILLKMIEDKPHRAIQYISELIDEIVKSEKK